MGVATGDDVLGEAARRRTFAIISHPDAGKTTLTEKFLLYAGALQEAGAVHARQGRRAATSDWMEMERKRGISITSTVLQFPYRDSVCNLLDTPGHRDFSEDTYRVLTAVDAVIMVLDAAKGIEPQTLKLFEVCRLQRLPVLTLLNKFDRPGLDVLELLDEIERKIGLRPTPVTWPVGIAGDLRGVIDRRDGSYTRFTRTIRGQSIAPEENIPADRAALEEGSAWIAAMEGADLLEATGSNLDMKSFLAGESTPVFVGSALTNFGVRHLLDAVVDLVPAPQARTSVDGIAREVEASFSAFVFKVQANMDPSHRDRIAFARICSGTFERGMDTTCARSGKPVLTKYAATVFGSDRDTVEVAYPGDVVGLVNAAGLQLGDTIFAGPKVRYPGIPRFVPEAFATARPKDTGRFKQFRKGLEQLDEEGVVQVLRDPEFGDQAPVIAAVGPLQFDVFIYRLAAEFGAPAELSSAPYEAIRLTDADTAAKLREVGGVRILRRGDGELVALFESVYRLRRLEGDRPELTLLPLLATTG